MKKKVQELQRLKGVGEVLADRLAEAGLDTFAKVAAAGEEGLRQIRGMNPRSIPAILAQAAELAEEGGGGKARRVAELKESARSLRDQVQGVALQVRERFRAELAGKSGRKLERELVRVIDALESVEGKLETRVKRAGKGLAKAERRLTGLAEGGLKKVGKGLKRARKSLQKVFA